MTTTKDRADTQSPHLNSLPGFNPTNPSYFKDPMLDRIMGVLFDLSAELWIVKDRAWVMETLLERNGIVTEPDIEEFCATDEQAQRHRAERDRFINRVFASMQLPEQPYEKEE